MHEHPTGPAGTPRCALAHPGARMAMRERSYRGPRGAVSWVPAGRVAALRARVPRPNAQHLLARAPTRPTRPLAQPAARPAPCRSAPAAVSQCPSGRVIGPAASRLLAMSWAGCVVLQHSPALPPLACDNTIYLYCDTGILTSLAAYCNTIHCIATQLSSSPFNTIPVAIQFCIATQPSLFLQYNPVFQPSYCNTKISHNIVWAVAEFNFSAQNFLFQF